jgi:hypothetical protein
MEMPEGKPMYSSLIQTRMSFFWTKTENRRIEQVPSEELVPVGGEKMRREGVEG